jgi:hypothetical protein
MPAANAQKGAQLQAARGAGESAWLTCRTYIISDFYGFPLLAAEPGSRVRADGSLGARRPAWAFLGESGEAA